MNSFLSVAHGIEFGAMHIREVGEDASDARIVVADIRHCHLGYGTISRHPAIQIGLGVTLIAAFLVALIHLVVVFAHGGTIALKLEATLLMFAFVGGWLIHDAVKKQHYLEVTAGTGTVKLRLLAMEKPSAADEVRRAAEVGSRISL